MKKMVYLIGGGPGSGKSTVADAIHKKYGYQVLRGDELEGVHREEAAERMYPVNSYINNLEEKDRPIELIRLSAQQEKARHEELFFILLKELRNRSFHKLIIEGNFLIPDLVLERFEFPYKAVWLLPTLKFQSEIYLNRDWAHDLIKKTKDPTLTLHNWVRRDHQFNMDIKQQAKKNNMPYLLVNGKKPLSYSIEWAEESLELNK